MVSLTYFGRDDHPDFVNLYFFVYKQFVNLFDPKDSICYYRDKKGKEVDFILIFDEGYYPFEVKYRGSVLNSDFIPSRSFKKGILIIKDEIGTYRNYVKIPTSVFLLSI